MVADNDCEQPTTGTASLARRATGVDAAEALAGSAVAGNPYGRLLRVPGARAFTAAGFVGRMPMSMYGLGVVLLVSAVTGKYGTAGEVSATGIICYALFVPRLGRLTDRFGQARVLRPLIAVFTASAVAFIACAEIQAPLWTLFVTGGALRQGPTRRPVSAQRPCSPWPARCCWPRSAGPNHQRGPRRTEQAGRSLFPVWPCWSPCTCSWGRCSALSS